MPIDANTTYVASYHAPNGHYAGSNDYFANGGFDSAPLHALGDGVDGPNGVYKYGPSGGLFSGGGPDTFQSSNYWVDVVFNTDVGPDTTPPTISARSPGSGASGVATGANVTATFSEAMNASTIDGTTVQLRDPSNAVVAATVSYSAAQRRVTLDPNGPLQNSTDLHGDDQGRRRRGQGRGRQCARAPTTPGRSRPRRRHPRRRTRGRAARSW